MASLLAAACLGAHAHDDEAAAAARLPGRIVLLARAQSELERGDATQALDDFERAAMMLHAADAELGLIRAAMQAGQYRRALAFCAHTAGEHTDSADGGALYAWLLRVGGQPQQSERVLAQARAHAPDDPIAAAVASALRAKSPIATGILLAPPHRMAPWPAASGARSQPAAAVRFAGNAVLMDDGGSALLPQATLAIAAGRRLWVRNGLGESSEATPDRTDATLESVGLARLKLRAPLSGGHAGQTMARAAFAGSPGFAVQFGAGAQPAWPTLVQGFLGNPAGNNGLRKLGFDAASGAPVLDAKGMLAGIVMDGADGQAVWLASPTWAPVTPAAQEAAPAPPPPHAGPALVAPDEIYEAGLHRALQVLVDTPG
jgi:hypothetical protein